jgi:hypothetical protein
MKYEMLFIWFSFFSSFFVVFFLLTKKLGLCSSKSKNPKEIDAKSNNVTNQAPVPSVCVRVPHSPSLDSAENSVPSSPIVEKHSDFATLVVRE